MKRAAGQIRKVRRNKGCEKDSNDEVSHQNDQAHHHSARRKPTPEEAALTAKNYRLAKELSDLRVRNREECKAVSRLTMENMNLASRWREAISHVAMLRKELALHQRRAAEAFAQHKEEAGRNRPSFESTHCHQNQTSFKLPTITSLVDQSPENTTGGTSLQDVAAEMDRMDRILSAHKGQSGSGGAPPPPCPKDAAEPTLGIPLNVARDHPTDSRSLSCSGHKDREGKKTQYIDQPVTPSPRKENDDEITYDGGVDEEDEFDLPPSRERPHEDFFSITGGNQVVAFDGIQVDDPPLERFPPSVTPSESPPSSPPQQNDSSPASPESIADSQKHATEDLHKTGPPLFPMTASPKLITKTRVFNEEFPSEISSVIIRHPRCAVHRTNSECNDIAEEENTASNDAMTRTQPVLPLSGIDAFEASFATPFPDSFSPSEDNMNTAKANSLRPNTEEYNPFFPSLSMDEAETRAEASPEDQQLTCTAEFDSSSILPSMQSESRRGQADNSPSPVLAGRPRSSGINNFFPTSHNSQNEVPMNQNARNEMESGVNSSPQSEGTASKRYSSHSDNSCGLADSPSSSKTIGVIRYETPPQSGRSPECVQSDRPKRPEKAGAASARARYEKALQPRGFAGIRRPQRRTERDVEREASDVDESMPSAPSAPVSFGNKDEGNNETDSYLHVESSNRAVVQARVKERTAVYSGVAAATPGTENTSLNKKGFGSVGQDQWASCPSPTESVASKPWDEEMGDIPNEMSPGKHKPAIMNRHHTSSRVNGHSGSADIRTSRGTSYFIKNCPLSQSPSSSFRRQSMTHDRPWESRSSEQQNLPSISSHTAGSSVNNIVQLEDSGNLGESVTSRFIAAGKSRRRVKQPVSYAEPPLNLKLRRGDAHFPKAWDDDDTEEMRCHVSSIVHL